MLEIITSVILIFAVLGSATFFLKRTYDDYLTSFLASSALNYSLIILLTILCNYILNKHILIVIRIIILVIIIQLSFIFYELKNKRIKGNLILLCIILSSLMIRLIPAFKFYPSYFGADAWFHKWLALVIANEGLPRSLYNSFFSLLGFSIGADPPGHHIFMAINSDIFNISVKWIAIAVTPVLSTLLVLTTYKIAYIKTKDRKMSMVSSLFLVFSPYFVFTSSHPGLYRFGAYLLIYSIILFIYLYFTEKNKKYLVLLPLFLLSGFFVHLIFDAIIVPILLIALLYYLIEKGFNKKILHIIYLIIIISEIIIFYELIPMIFQQSWNRLIFAIKIQYHYGVVILGVVYWFLLIKKRKLDFLDYIFGLFWAISLVFHRGVYYALPIASIYTSMLIYSCDFFKRRDRTISILMLITIIQSIFIPLYYWIPRNFIVPTTTDLEVIDYLNNLKDKETFTVFINPEDFPGFHNEYRGSYVIIWTKFHYYPQIYIPFYLGDNINVTLSNDKYNKYVERGLVHAILASKLDKNERNKCLDIIKKIEEDCNRGVKSWLFTKFNIKYILLKKPKTCKFGKIIFENKKYRIYEIDNPYYEALKWISINTREDAIFLSFPQFSPHVGVIRKEILFESLKNKNLKDFSCKNFKEYCAIIRGLKNENKLYDILEKYNVDYLILNKNFTVKVKNGKKIYSNEEVIMWKIKKE